MRIVRNLLKNFIPSFVTKPELNKADPLNSKTNIPLFRAWTDSKNRDVLYSKKILKEFKDLSISSNGEFRPRLQAWPSDIGDNTFRFKDLRGLNLQRLLKDVDYPDLTGADLRGAILPNDLSKYLLNSTDLRGQDLRAKKLPRFIEYTDLRDTLLPESCEVTLKFCNLAGLDLRKKKMWGNLGLNLTGAILPADCGGVFYARANLAGVDLRSVRGFNTETSNLVGALLSKDLRALGSLNYCDLSGQDLSESIGFGIVPMRQIKLIKAKMTEEQVRLLGKLKYSENKEFDSSISLLDSRFIALIEARIPKEIGSKVIFRRPRDSKPPHAHILEVTRKEADVFSLKYQDNEMNCNRLIISFDYELDTKELSGKLGYFNVYGLPTLSANKAISEMQKEGKGLLASNLLEDWNHFLSGDSHPRTNIETFDPQGKSISKIYTALEPSKMPQKDFLQWVKKEGIILV